MAETALNFGPDWLRALAHGSTSSSQPPPSNVTTIPKYSLAQYRYGREEMLALMPKDPKKPECLKKDTSKVVRDTFTLPLALTPATEDEQRLWSRSVNSDAVLRASGKSVPGNNMGRSGRGGSVDRGRGRGRGSYYQRGTAYEDAEDGPPTSFSRPKTIERSQSANEKDQRWDDRDRRFDRPFSGRGGGLDDSMVKSEQSRSSNEYWRKFDKEDDSDWRSSSLRSSDKLGGRGSWRNPGDKERRDIERNPSSRSLNGNSRGSHMHQKTPGNHLPEWSVEESNEQDVVGTFDSTGAFLEPKLTDNSSIDDIYVSDEADEGTSKDSPEAKKDSSKKTPKKSSSQSQISAVAKQNSKQTEINKAGELLVDKHSPKSSEPHSVSNKTVPGVTVNKTADHVIKSNSVVQHHIVNNKKPDYTPVTLPNVPEVVAKSTKSESVILSHSKTSEISVPNAAIEEDAFAHHQKATENMVAQWTEEEEQRVISQTAPVQEKDCKWYYQDPQGEIQGPFTSPEMLEWFTAGYFAMSLMVRRSCDEKFSQLGDLIKSWGRVPFTPGNSPPPIRATPTSLPTPVTQTIVPNPVAAPVTNHLPKQEDQLLALQQQLLQQQLMQQQLLLRQAQLQQILAQLKQQDNFTSLNSQQQQQVVMQQFMAQQQMPRPNMTGVSEQQGLVETMTPLPLPLLGLPMAPLLKNDLSLWNVTPPSNPWPVNTNVSQPSGTSIWDVDPPKSNSEETEFEKQKHLVEEQEKLRKAEEERLAQEKEMEEKRKLEELRRKQEEERLLIELQKQEEEKKKLEEQKRREEEKRRQEELRRLEEQKRKEEEMRIRREEELRKIEEQKRLEELKRQEEQKRLEEARRKEEEHRQEELRKQEEQRKLEEKLKREELQRKIEMEKERERIELEKQKEAARLKELEREQQLFRERQKQKEEELRRLAEIKLKSQGPAWGIQNSQSDTQLSLADIQRLQEEKEREEREEKLRQQLLQQQALKQAQQSKNGLSWAKRSSDTQPAVKSLAEIQQEEAERLAQQQRNQKLQAPAPVINTNVGVWGNASHLNRITTAPPSWNTNSVTSGFWDDALSSSQVRKQTSKTNDSAFPALTNPEKPATTVHSNKSKNVRAKKEEDAVTKLFGNRKPTDEFTAWCTEALSAMPSSVDVPTFVAFLKDIESPYEVHDYVRSYLGDGKEPREFAKLFLDKRSKFRAKQMPTEDNMLWGPAPAVNPVVNKSTSQPSNDNDGNSNAKGKSKRRKNRMQKLDSSMLGFTVQSNPDRLNVGEIDHVDGM